MKKKVIIDCDPGIDDSLALMLALNSPELDVQAITIVSGNVPVSIGFENAKIILKKMNRLDIPIYQGESVPLVRDYISAQDTHGMDGLGESNLEQISGYEQTQDAVSYLVDALTKERYSIIALGPMTNLAKAFMQQESMIENIEEIVSMGGTFKSHGNCSPVAEYNYWCDPDAAAFCYDFLAKHHVKIHMVGLDVTREIVLTPSILSYMKRLDAHVGGFVEAITNFYMDFHWEYEKIIGCVINDPLAVAYFIDRELCHGFDAYTAIETTGISIGQSVVDAMDFYHKEPNAHILTEVHAKQFMKFFIERLTGKTVDEKYI